MTNLTTPQTISVGQFVVVPTRESEFSVRAVRVDALGPSIIRNRGGYYARETAIAAFDTKEEAERLVSTIAAIGAEYQRAVQAAHKTAREQIERAVARRPVSDDRPWSCCDHVGVEHAPHCIHYLENYR